MPRSTKLEDKYNNTSSGLTATTYQGAIDELVVNLGNYNTVSVMNQATITQVLAYKLPNGETVQDFVEEEEENCIIFSVDTEFTATEILNLFPENTTLSYKKPNGGFNTLPIKPGVYSLIYLSNFVIVTEINNYNNPLDSIEAPTDTEDGSVVIYNGTNFTTTDSLIIDENNCSIGTVDDRGYDWCNWQIGTNGSSFTSNKKSLGTKETPTAITNTTKIGGWGFIGDDGVTPTGGSPGYVGAEISAYAIGDQNASNGGTRLQIDVTKQGEKTPTTIFNTDNTGQIILPNVAGNRGSAQFLYLDSNNTLLAATKPFILDEDTFTSNSSDQAPSQQSTKVYVDNNVYQAGEITSNTAITIAQLRAENTITSYRIGPNITLTAPTGYTFVGWNEQTGAYVNAGNTFTSDSLKANIYDVLYIGTTIVIAQRFSFASSFIKRTANTTTDAAINYNTTTWTPVQLSNALGTQRNSNKYPITASNTGFTMGYTGWASINFMLNITSTGQRVHLVSRIFNVTKNEVIAVTDFSYIRSVSGHNEYTLQSPDVEFEVSNRDEIQVQIRRNGTITTSTTLDSNFISTLRIKSIII